MRPLSIRMQMLDIEGLAEMGLMPSHATNVPDSGIGGFVANRDEHLRSMARKTLSKPYSVTSASSAGRQGKDRAFDLAAIGLHVQ